MAASPFPSRTYDPRDLALPQMAHWARSFRSFAARLALRGTPFAVNGVLRRRVFLRRHKLWEYAASAACLFAPGEKRRPRILDFGGAATLPVYLFAGRGCQVECLDIDERLCEATRRAARRHGWPLRVGSHNLVDLPAPRQWTPFDAVISASVLEHLPKERQGLVISRLAGLLRPGGVFVLTFDFGEQAPQPGAVRTVEEVERLAEASGLAWMGDQSFVDTGARFALDRRYPDRKFTFGALFLERKT
jgi:SAM-dependent methyltransferase